MSELGSGRGRKERCVVQVAATYWVVSSDALVGFTNRISRLSLRQCLVGKTLFHPILSIYLFIYKTKLGVFGHLEILSCYPSVEVKSN